MIIQRIICENMGPIDSLDYTFRKMDNGDPVPLVIVGENGSGKSIVVSCVADAFFEFADVSYQNATRKMFLGHKYFKTITHSQIKTGKKYLVSFLQFLDDEKVINYLVKSGNYSCEQFVNKFNLTDLGGIAWLEEENEKTVNITKEVSSRVFQKNTICYFPPSRFEKPNWMGNDYYRSDVGLSDYENYSGQLHNPILVNDVTKDILQWMLDVIADSRPDLIEKEESDQKKYIIPFPDIDELRAYSIVRNNIETIMGTILGKEVVFRMRHRGSSGTRLSICSNEGVVLIPSLDALSTGQMALFLLFSTIVRYADHLNINNSIQMEKIEGIVVVDEIDLHLHSDLQRNTVAKLMRLFPKVQFIVTTHSPLVLLGLQEEYGDNIDIIEMPNGNRIFAEEYSQFENAYRYYSSTAKYRQEIRDAIEQRVREKPLIITEGASDWRHMKAAYNHLKECEGLEWLKEIDFEFLEYSPKNSKEQVGPWLQMSNTELKSMALNYASLPQSRKMIFIADNDDPKTTKTFITPGAEYEDLKNNVYAMTLPVPHFRIDTPEISVEHLYHDEDLKKWVITKEYKRRIFVGCEFDKTGHGMIDGEMFFCRNSNACGEGKIAILDGEDNKKITQPFSKEPEKNYALSKMTFANLVLRKEKPFDTIQFDGFIPLFEVIRHILQEK